ncbi:carbon storage regulator, CsrA [Pelosinus fermentans]|uniref:carbon storage regulator CsrA n=1 Tax=Pelosinus fermentans TaxID=365349 RepID=UPI0002685EA1|nr:carbon storage regulator CsrA [Pelosinus fermentans]OAM92844.1 carbon storage regulator, CsrA [Pelosinus fermentans DSM 17108]SDQ58679.1 carbon storage regulator, CsrA [Pelosinus fermentans]
MLILTRKKNETLRIGDDILITIVDIQGDQIRLGITAPREVSILRQELYEAVKNSNTQAALTLQNMDMLSLLKKIPKKDEKE